MGVTNIEGRLDLGRCRYCNQPIDISQEICSSCGAPARLDDVESKADEIRNALRRVHGSLSATKRSIDQLKEKLKSTTKHLGESTAAVLLVVPLVLFAFAIGMFSTPSAFSWHYTEEEIRFGSYLFFGLGALAIVICVMLLQVGRRRFYDYRGRIRELQQQEDVLTAKTVELQETHDALQKSLRMGHSLERARNYERAGRYEEAARIYESFELWDEAGRARRHDKEQFVTKKTITMNLNRLLEEVRHKGIVARYTCPSCGSSIDLARTTVTGKCTHCRSSLDTMTIEKFLRSLLG